MPVPAVSDAHSTLSLLEARKTSATLLFEEAVESLHLGQELESAQVRAQELLQAKLSDRGSSPEDGQAAETQAKAALPSSVAGGMLTLPPQKAPKPVVLKTPLPEEGEKEIGGIVRPSTAAVAATASIATTAATAAVASTASTAATAATAAIAAAAVLPDTPSSSLAQALAGLSTPTPSMTSPGTPKTATTGFFSWMSASKGGPVVSVLDDDKLKSGGEDVENKQKDHPAPAPVPGPASVPGPTSAPVKKASASLAVYIREISTFICAAVSVAAAISSYQQLRFAATDVQSVIASWQVTPISSVLLVPYPSVCPANFSTLSTLQWPGSSSLGCGCPAGAQYQGVSYSSLASSSCSSLHLLAGCVANAPSGLSGVALDAFRGSRVCYQRGLASYVQTAEPSAAGACPGGFHKCGSSNGTYSSDRSQCVPDALGQGCPVTWLGTDFFLSQSLRSQGSSVLALPTLPKLKYKSGTTLHMQRQSVNAVKLQTPLIDLVINLQQSADQRGPCYRGPSQAAYSGPGVGLPAHPAPCTSIDSRWVPLDLYTEEELLQENFDASGQAKARCPSYSSLKAAAATDFFKNGVRCNNTATAKDTRCESGLSSAAVSCAAGDTVCQETFYQSKCGHLVHAARAATSNVGVYMRPQTYWKEACPYSPSQVRGTEDPITASINAQYALLVINCLVNAVQAIVSIYIIAEKLCRIEGKAGKIKDSLVARVAKLGQVIKLPVIIASIVCVSAIYNFYALLSAGKCSDDITNASFDSLNMSLPGVLYGNIATFVCDIAQLLLVPLLVMAYRKHKKPEQVQCTMQWARQWPSIPSFSSLPSFRPWGGSVMATAPAPAPETGPTPAPAAGPEGASQAAGENEVVKFSFP